MILFYCALAFVIASVLALFHKETMSDKSIKTESRLTIFIKTFIISFATIYIGHTFFYPIGDGSIMKTHVIEVGDPDF